MARLYFSVFCGRREGVKRDRPRQPQARGRAPGRGHPSDPSLRQAVRALAGQGHDDEEIAAILNQEGLVSSWHVKDDAAYVPGQPVAYWNADRVRHLRYKHKVHLNPSAAGLVSAHTAAQELGVSVSVILDWFRRGLLPGRQPRPGAPVRLQLNEAEAYRLSGQAPRQLPFQANCQPPLTPLAQAGQCFGLSAAQLTAALKAGRFLT